MKKELLKDVERIENEAKDYTTTLTPVQVEMAEKLVDSYLYTNKGYGIEIRRPWNGTMTAIEYEVDGKGKIEDVAKVNHDEGLKWGGYYALKDVADRFGFKLAPFIDLKFVEIVKELIEEEDSIVEHNGAFDYRIYEDAEEKEDNCYLIVSVDPECPRLYWK